MRDVLAPVSLLLDEYPNMLPQYATPMQPLYATPMLPQYATALRRAALGHVEKVGR